MCSYALPVAFSSQPRYPRVVEHAAVRVPLDFLNDPHSGLTALSITLLAVVGATPVDLPVANVTAGATACKAICITECPRA